MNGRCERRTFGSLDAAKEAARMVALNIQRGMSSDNDLRPQDRESLRVAQTMLAPLGLPLVAVVEEYLQCRRKLGEVPLLMAVDDFTVRSRSFEPGVIVPRVEEELLQLKRHDRINAHYLKLLEGNLRQFGRSSPTRSATSFIPRRSKGWRRSSARRVPSQSRSAGASSLSDLDQR